jgi:hypothetical protein
MDSSSCQNFPVMLHTTQITKRKHKIVVSDKETQAKNPKP